MDVYVVYVNNVIYWYMYDYLIIMSLGVTSHKYVEHWITCTQDV